MGGFEDNHYIDGDDDNFLSASGKSRKVKRAEKKAEKESKLREKKGAELSASVAAAMGMPVISSGPEKKKGLKGLFSRLKENRQEKKADKLYKKDYERSKKAGTLSTADFSKEKAEILKQEKEKEKSGPDLSKIKDLAMGLPSLLGLGPKEEEEEKPQAKKMDSSKIAMYAILGLGGLAILAIAFSKGMPQKSDK